MVLLLLLCLLLLLFLLLLLVVLLVVLLLALGLENGAAVSAKLGTSASCAAGVETDVALVAVGQRIPGLYKSWRDCRRLINTIKCSNHSLTCIVQACVTNHSLWLCSTVACQGIHCQEHHALRHEHLVADFHGK